MMTFKSSDIRPQFPYLQHTIHGRPLVYLDSAATTQKPECVLEAEDHFYRMLNGGVHRGSHELAARATHVFEEARDQVSRLINATCDQEIKEVIVTHGATDSLNMLARSYEQASYEDISSPLHRFSIEEGDEIVLSPLEHHSVLLPFQELARRRHAHIRALPINHEEGTIDCNNCEQIISSRTKIVALTAVSNVTGSINPIAPLVKRAHEVGAIVVLDIAQAVGHIPTDIKALDVDFAVWSAHKMYGPTGIGFLYGRWDLLQDLPPSTFGGSMVGHAWIDRKALYLQPPYRFEAGTQPTAQMAAAGVAAQWLMHLGMENIFQYEEKLTSHLLDIANIEGIRILGSTTNQHRIGLVSFEVEGVHPHDVGQYLDSHSIAIRTGHQCAQPVHQEFGCISSNRASVGIYNTQEEIDYFIDNLKKVRSYFSAK